MRIFKWIRFLTIELNTTPCIYVINMHRIKILANIESISVDGGHAFRDSDRDQAYTVLKCIALDRRHPIWDGDRSQTSATSESSFADGGHTIGDVDRCKVAATIESTLADRCNTIGDNCIFASSNQCVTFRLKNCITIITTIIFRVSIFNNNGCQASAIRVFVTYCILNGFV